MPTLDATVGGADANTYALVAAADTYFDERLQASAWTGESDTDVKERALIMATRQLDVLDFVGYRNSTTQALQWPRSDVYDRDGEPYATDSIPAIVQQAMFEIALDLLNANAESVDGFANSGLEKFDRAKVGPLEVEPNHAYRAGQIPDRVMRMLAHVRASAGLMGTLERA